MVVHLYYSNNCGHCRDMKGAWAEYKNWAREKNVPVEEYEASQIHQLRSQGQNFDFEGYPTIKYISKNGETEYIGNRTANDFKKWTIEQRNRERRESEQKGGSLSGLSYSEIDYRIRKYEHKLRELKHQLRHAQ